MPKVVWIWPGFESFLAPFWDLEAFFSESFFYVFLEVPFSIPSRLLGTNGGQKASKMEPKWSPKGASGYFLGSEKTMVFIVREAYEGVSGRLWEAIFSRLRLQTLSGGVPGSILADFARILSDFGCPLGAYLGSFACKKDRRKYVQKNIEIVLQRWRGRRQGRGPSRLRICRIFIKGPITPCSPFGGAANLKASPLPPAPSVTCW